MSTPAPQSERLFIHAGPDVHGYPETQIVAPRAEVTNDSRWLDERYADFHHFSLWLIAAACGCLLGSLAVIIAFN